MQALHSSTGSLNEQGLCLDAFVVEHLHGLIAWKYNQYVPFFDRTQAPDATLQAAARVQKRCRIMQQILDEATEKLQENEELLSDDLDEFSSISQGVEMWWMSGNILELPYENIKSILKRNPPLDAEALKKYMDTLLTHKKRRPHDPERQRSGRRYSHGPPPVACVLRLINTFFPLRNGRLCAVHMYAQYIRKVLVPTQAYSATLDGVLGELYYGLFGCPKPVERPESNEQALNMYKLMSINRDPLRVEREHCLPRFTNLASVARTLEEAYWSVNKYYCQSYGRGHSRAPETDCSHMVLADALEYFQKEAYTEVRGKIMLTLGTLLPTELAELVLHWALVAECLPAAAASYHRNSGLDDFEEDDTCQVIQIFRDHRDEALNED